MVRVRADSVCKLLHTLSATKPHGEIPKLAYVAFFGEEELMAGLQNVAKEGNV